MTFFNDYELILLITIISILFVIFISYRIFVYFIYRQRKITYPLFNARDKLIQCVANEAISKEDPLFLLFYKSSNELINAVHTDFFTITTFIKSVRKLENDKHFKEKNKKLIKDLKKKALQFQEAVNLLISATQNVLIQKNLLLRFIIQFIEHSIHLTKAIKKLYSNNKKVQYIVNQKANYQEYKKLQKFKEATA